jgi:hypothetical protein
MTQDKPTDAQLVALAERLGWQIGRDDWGDSYFETPDEEIFGIPILRTWLGAGAIQAAMAGLGLVGELSWRDIDGTVRFYAEFFGPLECGAWCHGKADDIATGPDAIVLAARAALGVPS